MCKFQMAVYMLKLSRTEMLSTVPCSKFRGASFTFLHFLFKDGKPSIEGDYSIAGVHGTGSKVRLDYLEPGGSGTGKLLPTGNVIDEIEIKDFGKINVSIIDAATPLVYLLAEDIGLEGTETPDVLDAQIDKIF